MLTRAEHVEPNFYDDGITMPPPTGPRRDDRPVQVYVNRSTAIRSNLDTFDGVSDTRNAKTQREVSGKRPMAPYGRNSRTTPVAPNGPSSSSCSSDSDGAWYEEGAYSRGNEGSEEEENMVRHTGTMVRPRVSYHKSSKAHFHNMDKNSTEQSYPGAPGEGIRVSLSTVMRYYADARNRFGGSYKEDFYQFMDTYDKVSRACGVRQLEKRHAIVFMA